MKTLVTTILAIISTCLVFAQSPTAAIELTKSNILYRGYENKVKIAVNDTEGQIVSLVGNNCSVQALKTPYEFIVKPGNDKTVSLSVVLTIVEGQETIVSTTEYRIKLLPDPSIFWGINKSGNQASLIDTTLEVRYIYEVPLESNFRILKWTMHSEFGNASGDGADLTNARSVLNKVDRESTISMKVYVLSPDGITRMMSANWTVAPTLDD